MRLSKYEKDMLRSQKRTAALSGKGKFIYRNNTSGDLFLPRPTKTGTTRVGIGKEFLGDDYYMFMVRNNELRLVRQVEAPEVTPPAPPEEPIINEQVDNAMSDKLITEQPPVVTNEGTVEFVEAKPNEKLNESPQQQAQQDVLLNENPMDGIEII